MNGQNLTDRDRNCLQHVSWRCESFEYRIGREYGFHSSTERELSPLGRERKLTLLDKKSSKFVNPGTGIVSTGLTGDRKI
jgi:hypothetical protein